VLSPDIREKALRESRAANIVGTGRDLHGLMMPTDFSMTTIYQDLSELWTVVNGKRFRVEDKSSGRANSPSFRRTEGTRIVTRWPFGRYCAWISPPRHGDDVWRILRAWPKGLTVFRAGETGTYDVNSDCTGTAEIDFPPPPGVTSGAMIKLIFVLSNHGGTIHTVVTSLTPPGAPSPVPAVIHSDGWKLGSVPEESN
jgi:hypothetical protein